MDFYEPVTAVRRESSGAEPRSAALVPGRAECGVSPARTSVSGAGRKASPAARAGCRIEGAKAPRISAAWHGIIAWRAVAR